MSSRREFLYAIGGAGLAVIGVRRSAMTIDHWTARFQANRAEIAQLYDERFCRMWEFYLAGSETAFRVDAHMVMQIQIAKRQEVVPLTRDYIPEREAELRRREAARSQIRHAAE